MIFECPQCHRRGMVWDGRAKAVMCYFDDCHCVIIRKERWDTPSREEILATIKERLEQQQESTTISP